MPDIGLVSLLRQVVLSKPFRFSAERIDIATMQLLKKKILMIIFPQIGDRLRFEASLAMLRNDQVKDTVGFEAKIYFILFWYDQIL